MEYFFEAIIRSAVIVCLSGDMLASRQSVPVHCSQTTVSKKGFVAHDIIPSSINSSIFIEPPKNTRDLGVELCPNNRTLKLSWRMNRIKVCEITSFVVLKLSSFPDAGNDMTVCYTIKSALNGQELYSSCVSLSVNYPKRRSFMTCWFPMEYISYRPIITVLATTTTQGNTSVNYYGELNTNELDPRNSCKDVCEVTVMNIRSMISCNDESSIIYDDRITIKSLSFEANNSSSCHTTTLYISDQTSTKLDYILNCTEEGAGYIKVFYSIRGRYCFKYQFVRVFCEQTSTISSFEANEKSDVDDFQTFVVFGVICTVVFTFILIAINFVVQRLKKFLNSRSHTKGRLPTRHGMERVPLQANIAKPREESVGSSSSIVDLTTQVQKAMKREYIKRVDSVSSDGQSQQSSGSSSFRKHNVRKLHRCMTIALLERTESFYRKKILFLPSPFDTFSRDATSLLKAVFTLELSIPTQCCYDRDVYQKYMTVQKNNWIETILRDHDRIVIFLCFTTIHGEAKGRPIVEDVLEHLLISKPRPHCRVAFLHLTDSSENFERNHHGDSFHVMDRIAYEGFISEMLRYCGRNPESEPDLVYRLTNCETSRHFLRFIGIKSIL